MFFAVISLFLFTITITIILANVGLAKIISDSGTAGRVGENLDRAKVLNDKIISMNKIQENFFLFTDSLGDFAKIVPAGIQIDGLELNKENNSLRVKGIAATREDLIAFKKSLEDSAGRFSGVEIITEDISSKELVNFEIAAVVGFSKL